jgi:hypothetical protein
MENMQSSAIEQTIGSFIIIGVIVCATAFGFAMGSFNEMRINEHRENISYLGGYYE